MCRRNVSLINLCKKNLFNNYERKNKQNIRGYWCWVRRFVCTLSHDFWDLIISFKNNSSFGH